MERQFKDKFGNIVRPGDHVAWPQCSGSHAFISDDWVDEIQWKDGRAVCIFMKMKPNAYSKRRKRITNLSNIILIKD